MEDNIQTTFIMLKPDALKRGLTGEIISRIERKGYRITDIKMMNLSKELLAEHYAHIKNESFYPRLESYMMSGPVIAMKITGERAVAGMRQIMGATKFEDALAGTIRGDYATDNTYNLIHGSDSPENAAIEIKRFFGE